PRTPATVVRSSAPRLHTRCSAPLSLRSLPTVPRPPSSPLFPYTTLFRSQQREACVAQVLALAQVGRVAGDRQVVQLRDVAVGRLDRKSTRLNSSHVKISYAVFCLRKKKSGNGHRPDQRLQLGADSGFGVG